MSRLADRGYPVIYVCNNRIKWRDYLRTKKGLIHLKENLTLANTPELYWLLPFKKLRYYSRFGYKLKQLQPLLESLKSPPILWAYHPGYGHYLDLIKHDHFLLYDCVDDYATFPDLAKKKCLKKWIQEGENSLIKNADLVTTSALKLYEEKKSQNPNTHYVHNVGDFEHFNQVTTKTFPEPKAIAEIPKPRIGFFGAVSAFKLDVNLLEAITEQKPEWQFCLMGPTKPSETEKWARLKARKNVHFLGKIDYTDLPAHIQAMDVIMIPFAINTHTEHVFPIKFFEALATGKPVVSTPLPAYEHYGKHCRLALTAQEFIHEIQESLTPDKVQKEAQIAVAKKHDWNSRIDHILSLIPGL